MHSQLQSQQADSHQKVIQSKDILVLLDLSKTLYQSQIVFNHEKEIMVEYHYKGSRKVASKFFLKLNFHNSQKLLLKCFFQVSSLGHQTSSKVLLAKVNSLNQQLSQKMLRIKIYYLNPQKTIVSETWIDQQNLDTKFGQDNFLIFLSSSFSMMEGLEEVVHEKVEEARRNINKNLSDLKQTFEGNRMKREKATKISLLSKNMQKQYLSKIIEHYLDPTLKIVRKYRGCFKQMKDKLPANSHSQEIIKRFQQRLKKNKSESIEEESGAESEKSKNLILKPICLYNETLIQQLEAGGFANVHKCYCTFEQLDTIAGQTQQYFDRNNMNGIQNWGRVTKSEMVVRKDTIGHPHGQQFLQSQIQFLKLLKNKTCSQIAQYYVKMVQNSFGSQEKFKFDNQILYSKYYSGTLQSQFQAERQMKIRIMLDVAEGIQFMVGENIIHRDLKPNNILLAANNRVKIIDFGAASLSYGHEVQNKSVKQACNRLCFTQPYSLLHSKAKLKSELSTEQYNRHFLYDMYSFGKIMQEFINNGDDQVAEYCKYIEQKSMERNPEDRLSPDEVSIFMGMLSKYFSYLSNH